MDYTDRILWLLLGCFIGFVLGYIVRSLQEIKEEVDEIIELEKDRLPNKKRSLKKDERGTMKPRVSHLALFLVVGMSVWASFQTAYVNQQLKHTSECMTQYNTRLGLALSSRDSAIKAGTASEINLWTQYGQLYKQAKAHPKRLPALQEQLNDAITNHRVSLIELQETRYDNPYPDPDVLKECKENESD